MNVDALTSWLDSHPSAVDDAPDLVALAQTLARKLEDADTKEVASLAREYRMVLKDLHGLSDGDGDGQEDVAAAMRTPLRDSKGSKP